MKIAFVLIFALIAGAFGRVIIDDFRDTTRRSTTIDNDVVGPVTSQFSATGATIIGGQRDVWLQRTNDVLNRVSSQQGPVLNPIYGFSFSIDAGSSGNLTMTWDGVDASGSTLAFNLGAVDITQNGTLDSLVVRLFRNDLQGVLTLTFFNTATQYSTALVTVVPGQNNLYVFPFVAFGAVNGGNLRAVNAITLEIDSRGDSIDLIGSSITIESIVNASKTARIADANGDGFASAGEVVTWTVIIDNPNDGSDYPADNLVFTDDWNTAQMTLIVGSVTAQAGAVITRGNTLGNTGVTVTIASLPDGATSVITFQTTMANLGCGLFNVSNQGFITTGAGGRVGTDNPNTTAETDATVIVYRGVDSFSLVCTTAATTATVGTSVNYAIQYCNNGTTTSSNVVVRMTVPANTRYNPTGSAAWTGCTAASLPGSVCTLTIASVAPGCTTANFVAVVQGPLPCTGATTQCVTSLQSPCYNTSAVSPLLPLTAVTNIGLTKTARQSGSIPGQVIVFDLAYSNTGSAAASGTTITETVPMYTVFNAGNSTGTWSCANNSPANTTCTTTIASIAANTGTGLVSFAVQVVNPVPCPANIISNTAVIRDVCDATDTTAQASLPITASPVIFLDKSDTIAGALPGTIITYTIAFSNTGNRDAPGGIISDIIPQYSTFYAAGSTAGWSCTDGAVAGTNCTWNAGTLVAGAAQRTVNIAVRLLDTLPAAATTLNNTAYMYSTCAPPAYADEDTPILGNPNLVVTKVAGSQVYGAGSSIFYTITLNNIGTRLAEGVILTETLPVNTTFNAASSTPGWTCGASTCTLNVGTVNVNVLTSYVFAITVPATIDCAYPNVNNTVTVSTTTPNEVNATNNVAFVTTPIQGTASFILSETVSPTSSAPCSALVYTISYRNAGTACEGNAVLNVTVPQYTTYTSTGSSANWVCQSGGAAGSQCTYAIGRLCPSTSLSTVTFAVNQICPLDCGIPSITHQSSLGGICAPRVNSNVVVVPITGVADLRIQKTARVATNTTVRPGDVVTFDITAQNVGNRNELAAVVTEIVPANTVFVAGGSSAGWTCSGNNAGSVCTMPSTRMNVNASAAYFFAVRINTDIPQGVLTITNVASIAGSCDTSPAQAQVVLPIGGPPDLSVCKHAECEAVKFTITYGNSAQFPASGVVITEQLPPNGELHVGLSSPGWQCDASGLCLYRIANLPPNTQGKLIFAVRPLVPDFNCFENTVSIADDLANGPETDLLDNESSAQFGSQCGTPCNCSSCCEDCEVCEDCPTLDCDTQCPCPEPEEPCCPGCDSCCEPCQGDIENQVNFVFAGLIPGRSADEVATCCPNRK